MGRWGPGWTAASRFLQPFVVVGDMVCLWNALLLLQEAGGTGTRLFDRFSGVPYSEDPLPYYADER